MADEYKFYADRTKDPSKNDDSQPSVTSATEVLRLADQAAGVTPPKAHVPAPADAIDMQVRSKRADVDPAEVADAVVAAEARGEEADVEALGEGSPKTTKTFPTAKTDTTAKTYPTTKK